MDAVGKQNFGTSAVQNTQTTGNVQGIANGGSFANTQIQQSTDAMMPMAMMFVALMMVSTLQNRQAGTANQTEFDQSKTQAQQAANQQPVQITMNVNNTTATASAQGVSGNQQLDSNQTIAVMVSLICRAIVDQLAKMGVQVPGFNTEGDLTETKTQEGETKLKTSDDTSKTSIKTAASEPAKTPETPAPPPPPAATGTPDYDAMSKSGYVPPAPPPAPPPPPAATGTPPPAAGAGGGAPKTTTKPPSGGAPKPDAGLSVADQAAAIAKKPNSLNKVESPEEKAAREAAELQAKIDAVKSGEKTILEVGFNQLDAIKHGLFKLKRFSKEEIEADRKAKTEQLEAKGVNIGGTGSVLPTDLMKEVFDRNVAMHTKEGENVEGETNDLKSLGDKMQKLDGQSGEGKPLTKWKAAENSIQSLIAQYEPADDEDEDEDDWRPEHFGALADEAVAQHLQNIKDAQAELEKAKADELGISEGEKTSLVDDFKKQVDWVQTIQNTWESHNKTDDWDD